MACPDIDVDQIVVPPTGPSRPSRPDRHGVAPQELSPVPGRTGGPTRCALSRCYPKRRAKKLNRGAKIRAMYQPQMKLSTSPRKNVDQLKSSKPGRKMPSASCFIGSALVLLSQKVATNDEENHLFGKIHTSA